MRTCCFAVTFVLLAGQLGQAEPATAQTQDTSYGARAAARLLTRIHGDTRLPDSLRSLTLGGLDSLPTDYFAQLDDSAMGVYLRSTVAALRQLPESLCAQFAVPAGDNATTLLTLLSAVDSVTVDSLLLAHELALLAAARSVPQVVATPAEFQQAMAQMIGWLAPSDRQRFVYVAQHPPPSQSDACWVGRTLYGSFERLPPNQLGPVMRRMSARPSPAR